MIKVERVIVGSLECNCYILENEKNCLIIDPGDEYEKIKKVLNNRMVNAILVTHGHFDHVGCVEQFRKDFNCSVYKFDNLDEGIMEIGNFVFEVIRVPGHSKDSVSFYFRDDKVMFTGDFLFYDTIGRCDLEGGDYGEMLDSISKIKSYDDDIVVYPGHGRDTILGREKENNLFFK